MSHIDASLIWQYRYWIVALAIVAALILAFAMFEGGHHTLGIWHSIADTAYQSGHP